MKDERTKPINQEQLDQIKEFCGNCTFFNKHWPYECSIDPEGKRKVQAVSVKNKKCNFAVRK